jgi:hypothetical protein
MELIGNAGTFAFSQWVFVGFRSVIGYEYVKSKGAPVGLPCFLNVQVFCISWDWSLRSYCFGAVFRVAVRGLAVAAGGVAAGFAV